MKEAVAKNTILFVEDEPEVAEYMRRFLEELGYNVLFAANEDDSLRLMGEPQPNIQLILLSQCMDSDDALAAGRRIRTYINASYNAPVIVIPSEFRKDMEGKDEPVGEGDYKSYITSEIQLERLISGLLGDDPPDARPDVAEAA